MRKNKRRNKYGSTKTNNFNSVKQKTSSKNISTKYKAGQTVRTRDEFFEGTDGYTKPEYANSPNVRYRRAAIVDTNSLDELIIAKTYSAENHPEAIPLPDYRDGKTAFKSRLYSKDNEGLPITVNNKFKLNPAEHDLSEEEIKQIRTDSMRYYLNRNKLNEFKKREEKKSCFHNSSPKTNSLYGLCYL